MINSNVRKLCLSGWLKNNYYTAYEAPLKLQKFLLLYESFAKVNGEITDFKYLKGYQRGPVFSQVWGDYTKERQCFDNAADDAYKNHYQEEVNDELVKKSAFLVRILSEKELSELSHKMNIWKVKESRIMNGEHQVSLSEDDFNEDDEKMINLLNSMYPISLIEESEVISINNYYFIIKKTDIPKLTATHYDVLSSLTDTEELMNPVYVDIDEEGRLIVD